MKSLNKACGVAITALFLSGTAFGAVEVAKIGSRAVTDQDVKNVVGAIPAAQKQQLNQEEEAKKRIVENVVIEELFLQEAEKSGMQKDKEFLQDVDRYRRQVLVHRYLQKVVQPKVTEASIKKYFEKNPTRYSQDEVHAQHVLLKTEAEAKEVYDKAKKGEDFEVLAKKYSKDPSAAQNMGDLGFFTRSRMVPAFANAAFAMKPGEISEPVKTPFGYHVIKVIEKREGKPVKFDDVKAQVSSDLQNETIAELITNLKTKNHVTVFDDKVKSLKF